MYGCPYINITVIVFVSMGKETNNENTNILDLEI